jgi:segregation and condensation protein B
VTIVGHRDVPGKPAIYASTKQFLDYFNLKSLDELPPLSEIKDIDKINGELDLPDPDAGDEEQNQSAEQQTQTETDTASDAASEEASVEEVQKEAVVKLDADDESSDTSSGDNKIAEAMTAEH